MLFSAIVALFALASSSVFAVRNKHQRHHKSVELPNPVVCAQELAVITYEPKVCGVEFLKTLAETAASELIYLFNTDSITKGYLQSLLTSYGVGFSVFNALGQYKLGSSADVPNENGFTHAIERAITLGFGSEIIDLTVNSNSGSYYAVALRITNSDGQVIILYVYAPRSLLPTFC